MHFSFHLQFWQAHVWFEAIKQSGQFSFKKMHFSSIPQFINYVYYQILPNAPSCKMWQMRVLLAKLFVCQQKKIRFSRFLFCPQSKLGGRTLLHFDEILPSWKQIVPVRNINKRVKTSWHAPLASINYTNTHKR